MRGLYNWALCQLVEWIVNVDPLPVASHLRLILDGGRIRPERPLGSITGTVTDPSSAAIGGAKVEVKNLDNGSTFNAVTTQPGSFTIPSVPSGKYNLTISAPGFKTASETGVEVASEIRLSKVDVALQIGQGDGDDQRQPPLRTC